MIQNLTLRLIIGVAVGVDVWFILLQPMHLGGGITNVEVAIVLVLAAAATVAATVGLGRKSRATVKD
ncbi:hypothetical protein [Pedococcus sp. 5OH_020]|uniref:hypothetical protein n=1 Tax=Pedococcus sp. 5OH_020 TaxID=2989814 RepID=UPI0022E9E582|nr:hypothetical protein [Pedococcus sp. 5OH_020]